MTAESEDYLEGIIRRRNLEIDQFKAELISVRAEADTRHSEEWVAELEAHFAAKERELARVRLERDQLAAWVFSPAWGPRKNAVIEIMADGPGPNAELATALAVHDRRSDRTEDE